MFTNGNDNETYIGSTVSNLDIDMLDGADKLTLSADPNFTLIGATNAIVSTNTVEGGDGKDKITVKANSQDTSTIANNLLEDVGGAEATTFKLTAQGTNNAIIDFNELDSVSSDGASQKFDLIAKASAGIAQIQGNTLSSGDGKDNVKISADGKTSPSDFVRVSANEIALANGDNTIAIKATDKSASDSGVIVFGNTISGGDGADKISIQGQGDNVIISQNVINVGAGGDSSDTISISTKGANTNGSLIENTINAGDGDDKVSLNIETYINYLGTYLGDGKSSVSIATEQINNLEFAAGEGSDNMKVNASSLTNFVVNFGVGDTNTNIVLNGGDGNANLQSGNFYADGNHSHKLKIKQSADISAQVSDADFHFANGSVAASLNQSADGLALTEELAITANSEDNQKVSAKIKSNDDSARFADGRLDLGNGDDQIKLDISSKNGTGEIAGDASLAESNFLLKEGAEKISAKVTAKQGMAAFNGNEFVFEGDRDADKVDLRVSGANGAEFDNNTIEETGDRSSIKIDVGTDSAGARFSENIIDGGGLDQKIRIEVESKQGDVYARANTINAGDGSSLDFKMNSQGDLQLSDTEIGIGESIDIEAVSETSVVSAANLDFDLSQDGAEVDAHFETGGGNVHLLGGTMNFAYGFDHVNLVVQANGDINANQLAIVANDTYMGGDLDIDLKSDMGAASSTNSYFHANLEGEANISLESAGLSRISGTFDLIGSAPLNLSVIGEGGAAVQASDFNIGGALNASLEAGDSATAVFEDSYVTPQGGLSDDIETDITGNIAIFRNNDFSTGDASGEGGDQVAISLSGQSLAQFSFNTLSSGDGNDQWSIAIDTEGTSTVISNEFDLGAGDDRIDLAGKASNLLFNTLDGGEGTDKLGLEGPGDYLVLGSSVTNFEQIELIGGDNTLSIYAGDVENVTDGDNQLFVLGGSSDTVLIGAPYSFMGSVNENGTTFGNFEYGGAQLLIESGIDVNFV